MSGRFGGRASERAGSRDLAMDHPLSEEAKNRAVTTGLTTYVVRNKNTKAYAVLNQGQIKQLGPSKFDILETYKPPKSASEKENISLQDRNTAAYFNQVGKRGF